MASQPAVSDLEREIGRLQHSSYFQRLGFATPLEARFERDTAKQRSHRLWLEGLLAIAALNTCLLFDLALIRDAAWKAIVLRTALITPFALGINLLMRCNPTRWLREGSVAFGSTLICFIALYTEGNATAANTTFGLMCVLVTVLFACVVMRLRLPYAIAATTVMFLGGLDFLVRAGGLHPSERAIAASLLTIGVTITVTANYSLERQERLSYLLVRRSGLQAEELAGFNAVLRELSGQDKLTGLPNRRTFDERFSDLWSLGVGESTELSAIVVDIDHFKALNDVFGHLHGDQILQRVALLIPRALRGEGDFVARFGGEEFVVLLPNTSLTTALTVAERIRSLIEVAGTPVAHKDEPKPVIWVTVSCGVAACLPTPELHCNHLLDAADRALYAAKESGRNRVCSSALEERALTA